MPSYTDQVLIQICSISVQNQASPPNFELWGTSKEIVFGANAPIYLPPNRHTKSPPLIRPFRLSSLLL